MMSNKNEEEVKLLSIRKEVQSYIRRIQTKRQQLKSISNTLRVEIEKQFDKKPMNYTHFQMLKQSPAEIKKKYNELDKLNNQIINTKIQISSFHEKLDVGIQLQLHQKKNDLENKNRRLIQLQNEIKILHTINQNQNKLIKEYQDKIYSQQVKTMRQSTDLNHKAVKTLQKQIYSFDQQYLLLTNYQNELNALVKKIETKKKVQSSVSKEQIIAIVQQIQKLKKQQHQIHDRQEHESLQIVKKIKEAEQKNGAVRIKIRQIHNMILRTQMEIKAFIKLINDKINQQHQEKVRSLKQLKRKKSTSVQLIPLKNTAKNSKTIMEVGNFEYTPSGMFLSDGDLFDQLGVLQLLQITFFQQVGSYKILGIQMKYLNGSQIVSGKRMMSFTSNRYNIITFDIQLLTNLIIQYDKQNIYCVKVNTIGNQNVIVGRDVAGMSRLISLNEYKIKQIEAKLDSEYQNLNYMILKGLKLKLEPKKYINYKNASSTHEIESDTRTIEEADKKTERSLIKNKVQLPINKSSEKPSQSRVREIVDHRLLLTNKKI